MYKLKYAVQNYAWGKCGTDSEVYNLFIANEPTHILDNKPYAELWLGTHVSGPSLLIDTPKTLIDLITDSPMILGESSVNEFGNHLPFLLKVLAVNTALSIQVHPNKKQAEFLNKIAPDIYRDPNHKPELAIALTRFEALAGFRKIDEITFFIHSIPQLGELIGDIKKGYLNLITEEQKISALKICYKTLMLSNPEMVEKSINSLVDDFRNGKAIKYLTDKHVHLAELFIRLNEQYKNDVGCFSVFIFNLVILQPGESIFLSENLPHAYISGTAIECMAASDNVIRGGLTPKYKDIETLISMVNYNSFTAEDLKFKCKNKETSFETLTCDLFAPPISDFAVERIIAEPSPLFHLITEVCPVSSIILFLEGNGLLSITSGDKMIMTRDYIRGNSFFIAAHVEINIQANYKTIIYRAFANVYEETSIGNY